LCLSSRKHSRSLQSTTHTLPDHILTYIDFISQALKCLNKSGEGAIHSKKEIVQGRETESLYHTHTQTNTRKHTHKKNPHTNSGLGEGTD